MTTFDVFNVKKIINKSELFKILFYSFLWLSIIDIFFGFFIIGYKYKARRTILENYFSFGMSIEGKVKALVRENNGEITRIANAGWYPSNIRELSPKNNTYGPVITVYGMSFTQHIAGELKTIAPYLNIRTISGPGAPLNHSYYMFTEDLKKNSDGVCVIGILASTLVKINTVTDMNVSFESPALYFYPRYILSDTKIVASQVPVNSVNELGYIFADKQRINKLLNFFEEEDYFYNKKIFSYSWADYSMSARLIRRAYGQKMKRIKIKSMYDGKRFINTDIIEISKNILLNFATVCKNNKSIPIVLLLNDKGYEKSLDFAFSSFLNKNDIDFISSSDLFNSNDLKNFVKDGHFISENNHEIAAALLKHIKI